MKAIIEDESADDGVKLRVSTFSYFQLLFMKSICLQNVGVCRMFVCLCDREYFWKGKYSSYTYKED